MRYIIYTLHGHAHAIIRHRLIDYRLPAVLLSSMGNCQMCETDSGVMNEAEMVPDKEKYLALFTKENDVGQFSAGDASSLSNNHPVHAITRKAQDVTSIAKLQDLIKKSKDIIAQTKSGSSELQIMKPIIEVIVKAPSDSTLHESPSSSRVIQNCAAALLKLTYILVKFPEATPHQHIDAVSDTTHSIRQYLDDQCHELSYLITANEEYNMILENAFS